MNLGFAMLAAARAIRLEIIAAKLDDDPIAWHAAFDLRHGPEDPRTRRGGYVVPLEWMRDRGLITMREDRGWYTDVTWTPLGHCVASIRGEGEL